MPGAVAAIGDQKATLLRTKSRLSEEDRAERRKSLAMGRLWSAGLRPELPLPLLLVGEKDMPLLLKLLSKAFLIDTFRGF